MENPYQTQNLLFENAPVLSNLGNENVKTLEWKVYDYSESVNGSLVQNFFFKKRKGMKKLYSLKKWPINRIVWKTKLVSHFRQETRVHNIVHYLKPVSPNTNRCAQRIFDSHFLTHHAHTQRPLHSHGIS